MNKVTSSIVAIAIASATVGAFAQPGTTSTETKVERSTTVQPAYDGGPLSLGTRHVSMPGRFCDCCQPTSCKCVRHIEVISDLRKSGLTVIAMTTPPLVERLPRYIETKTNRIVCRLTASHRSFPHFDAVAGRGDHPIRSSGDYHSLVNRNDCAPCPLSR